MDGYRRILVPVVDNPESERAIDLACRLAAEHGGSIVTVSVIEIPPFLPFDAHMTEEEHEARRVLEQASAIGDSYGVKISGRPIRARDAANTIADQASANDVEVILIGGPRKSRPGTGPVNFGSTVLHVLQRAPCRVMVIAAKQESALAAIGQSSAVCGYTAGTEPHQTAPNHP